MVTSYRRLLSHSDVPYLLVVALTVKLSTPVLSLALLLAALDRLGSYTAAGFVLTGHALALAMSAPLGSRLVDRYGRRRVLTVYLAAHAVSYGLLLMAHQAGSAAMVGTAVLLGASASPVTAVVRGLWPEVVAPDAMQAAYVARWIREQRLERCHRDLNDPTLWHRPIHAIAAGWGIEDAAQFARTYRAKFGHTAQEYRRAAIERFLTAIEGTDDVRGRDDRREGA
ncbi:MFS transporter [Nonomuraea wenchangensis]